MAMFILKVTLFEAIIEQMFYRGNNNERFLEIGVLQVIL